MKKFVFFTFIFLFIFFSKNSYSKNLAYININYIINNSLIGQKVISDLEKINKKNLDILQKEQIVLNDKKKNIELKKNIISEEKIISEISVLNNEIDDFQKKQDKMSENFRDLNRQKIDELIKKINPIIEKYMEENQISVILNHESVYVSFSDNNITNKILDLVNKNLNE